MQWQFLTSWVRLGLHMSLHLLLPCERHHLRELHGRGQYL